ncbi:MAG TPA: ChbG/HpnK family deacetylase [Xanthobacteraceae bacterium]|nr:ChbG/HpnK family deacetylase [Xanthobacteraceae bacterium]
MNETTSRRIWLCADDYGIAPGVNAAIRDLVARGRLNATSVMVVAPSFSRAEAVALDTLNADRPRVSVGLHLTLTAPLKPLTSSYAPLVDGAFLPLTTTLRLAVQQRLDMTALAAELRAQFEAFTQAFGRPPDFVDGHQHVHLFPQIRHAALEAVAWMAPHAWARQCGSIRSLARRLSDPKGLLIDYFSREFRARAVQHGVTTNPAFAGTYTYRLDADFPRIFPQFLEGMPEGGLVMCHPGHVDDELMRLDPLTLLREKEYDYFVGDAFPADLAAAGVRLN